MPRFIPPALKDWNDRFNPPAAAPVAGGGLFPSTPNPGKGAYGEVPGSVDIPSSVSGGISRDLSGIVSPEVQSKLQNIAATWGIKNGMPGSGAQSNLYAHDYLGASDAARHRGFEDWKSLVPLQQQNNELAAAPNPQTRALTEQSFAQQMFNQYLAALKGGGSGQGGGYRSPAGGTGASNIIPQPGAMGGIPAVANPLPTPYSGTSVERAAPANAYDWESEEGNNYSIPWTTQSDGSSVPGFMADQLDPYSSYWDSIFNN